MLVHRDPRSSRHPPRPVTLLLVSLSVALAFPAACAGPHGDPSPVVDRAAHWVSADTIAWSAAGEPDATFALHFSPTGGLATSDTGVVGGASLALTPDPAGLAPDVRARFPHLAELPALRIAGAERGQVAEILKGQVAVSAVGGDGQLAGATGLQIPGVLDDLYAYDGPLGVTWETGRPTLRVWAPTARSVTLHLFADSDPATTSSTRLMTLDASTGVWSVTGAPAWKGRYSLYEVEVYVPATGRVEHNLVTDPYSLGLSMNSTRSQIVDLEDTALEPTGWDALVKPPLGAPEDISIYEIHVRDFSVSDPGVPDALKGTFKAFTLADTAGARHLEALQEAGLTHVHLLPVFDIATVNEDRGEWRAPDRAVLARYPPDSEEQQALVGRDAATDGYNWGYDPLHYTTPEGSYATDPDGPARILELREMVQALNRRGLRVVMDVVYNHTHAAGQAPGSVLDRIVPGYYHRLDDLGRLETSTCCANTASEHRMMEKLIVDSLLTWAREYKIDAFRFDLMGHHMKSNMERVRGALDALTPEKDGVEGRSIYLYGEGWNFGEVADGARGTNATQHNLGGTGIGTFNDRLRDAVRGGGPFDGGDDLIRHQGFASGLWYDPNGLNTASAEERETLLLLADRIRVGMAGNLAGYAFVDRHGDRVTGADVDYKGEPTGYAADPQENVVYVSKHDNQTLYDNNAYKAPLETSMADRVRMQTVGLSTVLLGQGVPFLHAGSDLLRSKSLDRDSYNSGDWFNGLDFTGRTSRFGVGLPVANRNVDDWPVMRPLLARAGLRPAPGDIAQMAERFRELLRIRSSSKLFRLETASQVQAHVAFHNTGPDQLPGLIVMSLADDAGVIDPVTKRVVVLINARDDAVDFGVPAAAGLDFRLHPVQEASTDPIVRRSRFDTAHGSFHVPGRTTAVFVGPRVPGPE